MFVQTILDEVSEEKILHALESVAQESDLTSLHLWASLNAIPFYKSAGYTALQQTKYLLPFSMVAQVCMVKKLTYRLNRPQKC